MTSKLYLFAAIALIMMPYRIADDRDECRSTLSCSSCIKESICKWCVTKSKCTKQTCGNDNVIYPSEVGGLMAGSQFCPRVVESEEVLTIKSGKKSVISVKITQIHLYMAFTPWKCKITFNGIQMTVVAMLLGDSVYCESVLFTNKSNEAYMYGSVSVLWDYSKSFDGSLSFKVCRCDLDPSCKAC